MRTIILSFFLALLLLGYAPVSPVLAAGGCSIKTNCGCACCADTVCKCAETPCCDACACVTKKQ